MVDLANVLIINNMQISKISQIICSNSHLMDSCEKRTRFSLISSGAKILIFRKCRKHFRIFLHLRRK